MSRVRHLRATDARTMPWKNGRGETTEIAIWPEGADFASGRFDWRISRAAVVEDGAFSSFPAHDRILLLLSGNGLEVAHDSAAPRRTLRVLEPYGFRGDWATSARLVDGPVGDFNVFCARSRTTARVDVVAGSTALPLDADHVLVHCVTGSVAVEFEGPRRLVAFETLWIEEPGPGTAGRITPATVDCRVLVVRITRA